MIHLELRQCNLRYKARLVKYRTYKEKIMSNRKWDKKEGGGIKVKIKRTSSTDSRQASNNSNGSKGS